MTVKHLFHRIRRLENYAVRVGFATWAKYIDFSPYTVIVFLLSLGVLAPVIT
jgi:hypothetical protein